MDYDTTRRWRKKKQRLRELDSDRERLEIEYEEKIQNLPKKFDYYCSACLHQTNEYSEECPKCGRGRLMRTSR